MFDLNSVKRKLTSLAEEKYWILSFFRLEAHKLFLKTIIWSSRCVTVQDKKVGSFIKIFTHTTFTFSFTLRQLFHLILSVRETDSQRDCLARLILQRKQIHFVKFAILCKEWQKLLQRLKHGYFVKWNLKKWKTHYCQWIGMDISLACEVQNSRKQNIWLLLLHRTKHDVKYRALSTVPVFLKVKKNFLVCREKRKTFEISKVVVFDASLFEIARDINLR